jgi:hypothetical protein
MFLLPSVFLRVLCGKAVLDRGQRLIQIGQEILNILNAD